MKTQNRYHIRKAVETHLINAGDLAYFPLDGYPPYTPQRLRVAISQIISHLPYQATARTIGDHIVVRRDTPPVATTLPGAPQPKLKYVKLLDAMRPWPDDPLYEQKTELIDRKIKEFHAHVELIRDSGK